MKSKLIYIAVLMIAFAPACLAQNSDTTGGKAQRTDLDRLLERYNSGSVPYISVEELKMNYDDYLILDARQREEYQVSHLPGAIWVGEQFDKEEVIQAINQAHSFHPIQKSSVVVYCSVGIRSEDFGDDMLEAGYMGVFNLYGSIFAWKDAGFEVVDPEGEPTDRVHVYSKKWGKYLKTGEKVF